MEITFHPYFRLVRKSWKKNKMRNKDEFLLVSVLWRLLAPQISASQVELAQRLFFGVTNNPIQSCCYSSKSSHIAKARSEIVMCGVFTDRKRLKISHGEIPKSHDKIPAKSTWLLNDDLSHFLNVLPFIFYLEPSHKTSWELVFKGVPVAGFCIQKHSHHIFNIRSES